MADVAVLGTGRMGAAMVRRLAAAGHTVRVWNRTAEKARLLVEELAAPGVSQAASAAEAVRGAEATLTMLSDGQITQDVLLDPTVMEAMRPGSVIVDLGTSGVTAARALEAGLGARGVRFVDAPVSGSVPAVESGTLLVMASGRTDAIDAAKPVLEAFARKVITLGPAGSGQAMKLAVNLVVHDLNAALSEALQLAEASSISREDAYSVLQESVVAAPFVQYKRPAFLDPDTPVAMSLGLVEKDLRLITAYAAQLDVGVPVTHRALDSVHRAVMEGWGGRDMADLSRLGVAENSY